MMSETIVGVTENFYINLGVLSAHFMHFYFFGLNIGFLGCFIHNTTKYIDDLLQNK